MTVQFFNNTSDNRKMSKNITSLDSANCQLKESCSLLRPSVILARSSLLRYAECNYMYIPKFHRYYYANVTAMAGDMLEISGNVDVLMTYANQLRALNVTIVRQENLFNDYFVDQQLPIRQTKTIQFAKIGTYNAGTGMYLTVDGGSE